MFMITKLRKISSGQFYVMLLLTNTVFIFTLSELSVKPYELLPSLIPLLISTAISLFMFYFSYSVAIKSGKSVLEYITIKNKPLANFFKAIYLFYFLTFSIYGKIVKLPFKQIDDSYKVKFNAFVLVPTLITPTILGTLPIILGKPALLTVPTVSLP